MSNFPSRRSHEAHAVRDVFAPPHLYGMLAATEAGLALLAKEDGLREMFSLLRAFPEKGSAAAAAELKAAVWAVCSVAATPLGAALVEREAGVLAAVVAMAERSASYPLRGTAVYALSLVASTRKGNSKTNTIYSKCSINDIDYFHVSSFQMASSNKNGL